MPDQRAPVEHADRQSWRACGRLATVLLWINGAFGVGKTTAAQQLRERDPRWRIFDPESVGYMLRANLAGTNLDDFQDAAAWRRLVPVVADELTKHTGDDLIAVQTVLNESYWHELRAGLSSCDIAVTHVVLDADPETLRGRVLADQNDVTAAAWRLDHIAAYAAARSWLLAHADLVIDATTVAPKAIAEAILAAVE